MTIEEVLDSKPIQFTGWSMVILMILGNLARFLTLMNVNDLLLLISSIIGLIYLTIKMITAFFTMRETIHNWRQNKVKSLYSGKKLSWRKKKK